MAKSLSEDLRINRSYQQQEGKQNSFLINIFCLLANCNAEHHNGNIYVYTIKVTPGVYPINIGMDGMALYHEENEISTLFLLGFHRGYEIELNMSENGITECYSMLRHI